MVERPIKKADRQPKGTDDNNSENSDSQPNQSNPKISKQGGDTPKESRSDRADTKGKKYGNADAPSTGGNPALARGPKPVKPKPPVVVAETEPEEVSQEPEA